MLVELTVENYAVIEKVRVRFHRGLNLLTGETGSGKSIVVDALTLLFGGRASAEMVRTGAERARISGIFEVAPLGADALPEALESSRKTASCSSSARFWPNGKSRAFAGNRPATAALLKDLAPQPGRYPRPARSAAAVFGRGTARHAGRLRRSWRSGGRSRRRSSRAGARHSQELEELDRTAQEKLRLSRPVDVPAQRNRGRDRRTPGEDAELENERRVLRNVVRLEETAGPLTPRL